MQSRHHLSSIRSELVLIVLAVALPVWLASALLLYKVQASSWAELQANAGATARSLMLAVDRDLASAEGAARVLATSPSLQSDDLAAFYAQARQVIRSGIGTNFVLSDASGEQLLDTLVPFGFKLPPHGDAKLLRQVFATGKPAISGLYIGGLLRRPVVSIDVPVFRGERVVYDLSIGFSLERIAAILQREALPGGWAASIVDGNGNIVARTHTADGFVGDDGASDLLGALARRSEGMIAAHAPDGSNVSALVARSDVSHWAVAIGIPTSELTVELWRSLTLSVTATVLLVMLSLVAAHWMSRRIVRPVEELGSLAQAIGEGRKPEPPSLAIKEANDLAQVLLEEARLVEQRTAERDRAEQQRQTMMVAKQHTEEATRARSSWFAYLCHELRTPLAVILGCSELIAGRARALTDDTKFLDYCGRIDRTIDHLSGVLNEILDYAKCEAHEIVLKRQQLDIAKEIRGVVELLEGRAAQDRIALRCEIAPGLPPLPADPVRLRQILLNLVTNALKFTQGGGTVSIDVRKADNAMLMLRVQDTGIGISPDDIPRILQPFTQVEGAQTAKRVGTGLGLPLIKGLAELHGGSLSIASKPGAGTAVTVLLPIQAGAIDPIDSNRQGQLFHMA